MSFSRVFYQQRPITLNGDIRNHHTSFFGGDFPKDLIYSDDDGVGR
jgi:hypothetical protein